MNRLLIVEDEALIRKGLRAIAERAPVAIAEILECKDGEEALTLLSTTKIDVMFTDVRMPQMDGLTLIREIQNLPRENRPEIVVISGHDDFNYAVEAMRYGSKEYILKPVKRERVFEILQKLNEIVAEKQKTVARDERLGQQQLKYILVNPDITDDEIKSIQDTFRDLLANEVYVLFCLNKPVILDSGETATRLNAVGPFHVLVYSANGRNEFIKRSLSGCFGGVSSPHRSLSDFKNAFAEAAYSRKYAFYLSKPFREIRAAAEQKGLPADLPALFGASGLAHRIGTGEYATLRQMFAKVFELAARGQIPFQMIEKNLQRFLDDVEELFGGLIEQNAALKQLREIYGFDTVEQYHLALSAWLDHLHLQMIRAADRMRNNERMEKALAYLKENYTTALNMAVVANYVGVNYSLFSAQFREFTGKNFVDYLRDLRIEKAKELLVQSDKTILAISSEIGYDNDKYFMKSFKEAVGISPTQYRRAEQLKLLHTVAK